MVPIGGVVYKLATAFFAASVRSDAGVMASPLLLRISRAFSTLVPEVWRCRGGV